MINQCVTLDELPISKKMWKKMKDRRITYGKNTFITKQYLRLSANNRKKVHTEAARIVTANRIRREVLCFDGWFVMFPDGTKAYMPSRAAARTYLSQWTNAKPRLIKVHITQVPSK